MNVNDDEVQAIAALIYESIHWGKQISDADSATQESYIAIASETIQVLDGMRESGRGR